MDAGRDEAHGRRMSGILWTDGVGKDIWLSGLDTGLEVGCDTRMMAR